MTQFVIANNVDTQLATATPSSGSGSTTITLASAANLPTLSAGQQMPLTLNDAATGLVYEVVYVTAISGVTLTVLRAQEGTGAQNWNIGDYAFCAPTQGTTEVTTGNPNLTFQVANATAANMAPNLGQIQAGSSNYAIDAGTANTYQVAYTPAITAVTDGMKLRFKAAHANTGASTFSPNGLTAAPIWGAGQAALQGGEIALNGDVEVVWNASLNTTGAWVMLDSTGGALQIAPATQSQHAVQLGQLGNAGVVPGRLLRTTVYRNNGGTLQSSVNGSAFANASSTFTALTATAMVDVEVQAGGGGGGGTQPTDSTHVAAGSGGGGGGSDRDIYTSGFNGVTITVGVGGASAANSGGVTGGSSSFGSLLSASGGTGGSLGTQQVANAVLAPTGGAGGGSGSGGKESSQGGPGFYALIINGTVLSGAGGASRFGSGPPGVTGTSSGNNATSPGSGGSGGSLLQSSATGATGGTGAGGRVIVWEYS